MFIDSLLTQIIPTPKTQEWQDNFMNILAKFAILSSTFLLSQVSNATPPSGTYTGAAFFYVGINGGGCNIEVSIQIYSNGNLMHVRFTPGDPSCNNVILSAPFHTSTGNNISFFNSHLQTSSGQCSGPLSGTWDGTTLTFGGVLYNSWGQECIVNGWAQ